MKRSLAVLPAVAAMVAMTIASSMPTIQPPALGCQWSDKLWHAGAFFVFGCFVQLAGKHGFRLGPDGNLVLVVIWSACFAAIDEWHQTMVPGRTGDVADWLADTTGASAAAALLWLRRSAAFRSHR